MANYIYICKSMQKMAYPTTLYCYRPDFIQTYLWKIHSSKDHF